MRGAGNGRIRSCVLCVPLALCGGLLLAAGCVTGPSEPNYAVYRPVQKESREGETSPMLLREPIPPEAADAKSAVTILSRGAWLAPRGTNPGDEREQQTVLSVSFFFLNRTEQPLAFDPEQAQLVDAKERSAAPGRVLRDGQEGGKSEIAPGHAAHFELFWHLAPEAIENLDRFAVRYAYRLGTTEYGRTAEFTRVGVYATESEEYPARAVIGSGAGPGPEETAFAPRPARLRSTVYLDLDPWWYAAPFDWGIGFGARVGHVGVWLAPEWGIGFYGGWLAPWPWWGPRYYAHPRYGSYAPRVYASGRRAPPAFVPPAHLSPVRAPPALRPSFRGPR